MSKLSLCSPCSMNKLFSCQYQLNYAKLLHLRTHETRVSNYYILEEQYLNLYYYNYR